jgi:RNA polymerase sporulation-specific sigma factor
MKKYYAPEADQEDLISIGTMGLIKAITTFDPSKGARLATYAARCVENATLTPATSRYTIVRPKAQKSCFGGFWTT